MRNALFVALLAASFAAAEEPEKDIAEQLTGPSAWITLPDKEIPVAEAFQLIAEQAHRPFNKGIADLEGKTFHGIGRPIPYLQALDEVANCAGCFVDADSPQGIAPHGSSARRTGAIYQGAFRVELDSAKTARWRSYRQWRMGSSTVVRLDADWEHHVHVMGVGPFEVHEAIDNQGGSLIDKDARDDLEFGEWIPKGWRRPIQREIIDLDIRLAAPLESRKVHLLSGSFGVLVERETKDVQFDKPGDQIGQARAVGDAEVTLTEFRASGGRVLARVRAKGTRTWLQGTNIADEDSRRIPGVRLTLADASGKEVGVVRGDREDDSLPADTSGDSWSDCGEGPFVLRASVVLRAVRRDISVEFRDFDLP